MQYIRAAAEADLVRIAEIEVFNYRLNFYPIFRNDEFYFEELQVPSLMRQRTESLEHIFVYDDGAVKGFLHTETGEVKKLFVEPVLQGQGIGAALLEYAIERLGASRLWALEKNRRAITFYERHGFHVTPERKPEEGTAEDLVLLQR